LKSGRRDLAALDASADALRNGAILLIFPEGHRSRNSILQPGRGGTIRL
jgi:1-acyl-sn-glycerol-3-phosphate acyltransferase